MDYLDMLSGHTPGNFWTMARVDLAGILVGKHSKKGNSRPIQILDIGAGVGNDIKVMCQHGEVDVIDINEQALAMIQDHLVRRKCTADITRMPFDDDSYDIAVAFDVLEHVDQDQHAIGEIRRVLRPGGSLIASVPAHPALFGVHDRHLGHVRRYTRHDLSLKLREFRTTRIIPWNMILFPAIALQRRIHNTMEPERFVLKFPDALNRVLFHMLKLETRMISKGVRLPFGLSFVIEAMK